MTELGPITRAEKAEAERDAALERAADLEVAFHTVAREIGEEVLELADSMALGSEDEAA